MSVQNADVLNNVALAMQSISMVQQRLASNLNLPAIEIDKFTGSPSDFPTFKQRFPKRIMSRDDFDDGEKMERLLQFLDGEAKEAVKSFEGVKGGVYKAMNILETRYGRKCLVVGSIVDKLVKGPPILSRDKKALRNFADKVATANATLESLDSSNEINQRNLVEMSRRLPKPLQEKFAGLAHQLEEKEERFPTLKDFASFLDMYASIANHPFNVVNPPDTGLQKEKTKTDQKQKFTLATGVNDGASNEEFSKLRQSHFCPCCSKPHPIYRCLQFKAKTPVERFELAKRKGLCYNCLKSNPIMQPSNTVKHTAATCPSKFKCRIEGCGDSHHTLLHRPKPQRKNKDDDGNNTEAASNSTTSRTTEAVLLQVVPVRVIGADQAITTYALLDSGSEISLVDLSLAEQLGVEKRPDNLMVSTVSNENDLQNGFRVDLLVESLIDKNPKRLELNNTWSSKELKIPLRHQQIFADKLKWHHLRDIPFPDVERKKISIIIGTNIPEAFIPVNVRHGGPKAPVVVRSCLGYSIFGRIDNKTKLQDSTTTTYASAINNVCIPANDVTLNQQLELFWKLESVGISRNEPKSTSIEDKRALKIIEETITKVNGHYQIGLLWKNKDIQLPNNRTVAEIRLRYLRKRLERDPELKKKYLNIIDDYCDKGYARRLTEQETLQKSDKTWYLPHHPVINPHKPGKVRAVFDAASKFGNTSLNDQLLKGPDLLNSLVGILIRFRQDPVVLIADIEAMFHQVRVKPEDCDSLRFLWWNGDLQSEPVEFQMLVHIFGAKSSPCCANKTLLQTADFNEMKFGKDIADIVRRNFYVDDLLKSVETVEKTVELAHRLIDLLAQGGFRLMKFLSNRKEVLKEIPIKERATPNLDLDLDQLPVNRTLGLCWDAETDEFYFSSIRTDKAATKRGILSVISSLFDPLGFLAPFIISAKVILQELWRQKIDWDEDIPQKELEIWKKWLQSIDVLPQIRIPRCYFTVKMTPKTMDLHVFSDASEIAYSASAYLRVVDDQDNSHCNFVMGKCRNSPLRRPTIPKLELFAGVMAVRLSNLILCEFDWKINTITYWTDSTTVLQYIKNESRRFNRFVATRLEEIHEHTTPIQWRFIPGKLIPADDGSRGLPIEEFQTNCRWWSVPEFLSQETEQWPSFKVVEVPESDQEVLKESTCQNVVAADSRLSEFFTHFSSWSKLLKCVSWLTRFVGFLQFKSTPPPFPKLISLHEMKNAARLVVKLAQREYFLDELLALESGNLLSLQ